MTDTPRYIKDMPMAREADRLARQQRIARAAAIDTLGFRIEERAGVAVVLYVGGGCRPASPTELALWKALTAATRTNKGA